VGDRRDDCDSIAVGAHYNGKIDHPRIYAHALSAAELNELAAARELEPAAPLASWDFSKGIGSSGIPNDRVFDISGTAYTGDSSTLLRVLSLATTGAAKKRISSICPMSMGLFIFMTMISKTPDGTRL
jgi:hypothetical protein